MKKKLIAAGAASLAVAAMPVVGVFATSPITTPNQYTDVLQVTIDKVCAFGYSNTNGAAATNPGDINVTGVARTASTGVTLEETATTKATGTFSATMVNGTSNMEFGTTTLGVYCNNVDGYKITSAFVESDGTTANTNGALLSDGTSKDIPVSANIATETTSAWSYKVESGKTSPATNVGQIQSGFGVWAGDDGIIVSAPITSGASKMTTNDGDYFKITYGVKIDETQPADTYSAGITYTLAQLP